MMSSGRGAAGWSLTLPSSGESLVGGQEGMRREEESTFHVLPSGALRES